MECEEVQGEIGPVTVAKLRSMLDDVDDEMIVCLDSAGMMTSLMVEFGYVTLVGEF